MARNHPHAAHSSFFQPSGTAQELRVKQKSFSFRSLSAAHAADGGSIPPHSHSPRLPGLPLGMICPRTTDTRADPAQLTANPSMENSQEASHGKKQCCADPTELLLPGDPIPLPRLSFHHSRNQECSIPGVAPRLQGTLRTNCCDTGCCHPFIPSTTTALIWSCSPQPRRFLPVVNFFFFFLLCK